ncbi:MAG: DUF4352 domain-containing protein [Chloroflexota bacterium]
MTQYYPPQGQAYPPVPVPESDDDYYDEYDYDYEDEYDEESGDSCLQRALIFISGGCLVFICMSCCFFAAAVAWGLDPLSSAGSTTAAGEGSDLGLAFEEPAFPGDFVVNEQNVRLVMIDVNRNSQLPNIPISPDREIIIITVEILNQSDEEVTFNEQNFELWNQFNEAYIPLAGALDRSATPLGRGVLLPGEGLGGRLVFEARAGELGLVLAWKGANRNVSDRYISLE